VVDGVFPARPLLMGQGGEITRHYVLIDYAARWTGGEPVAGDDAAEARFVSRDEAMALVEWDETRRVIAETYERFGAGQIAQSLWRRSHAQSPDHGGNMRRDGGGAALRMTSILEPPTRPRWSISPNALILIGACVAWAGP
jgi:hypothetical protein